MRFPTTWPGTCSRRGLSGFLDTNMEPGTQIFGYLYACAGDARHLSATPDPQHLESVELAPQCSMLVNDEPSL